MFDETNWFDAQRVSVIAIDDVVWAYRKDTTALVAFIPIWGSELFAFDVDFDLLVAHRAFLREGGPG